MCSSPDVPGCTERFGLRAGGLVQIVVAKPRQCLSHNAIWFTAAYPQASSSTSISLFRVLTIEA